MKKKKKKTPKIPKKTPKKPQKKTQKKPQKPQKPKKTQKNNFFEIIIKVKLWPRVFTSLSSAPPSSQSRAVLPRSKKIGPVGRKRGPWRGQAQS